MKPLSTVGAIPVVASPGRVTQYAGISYDSNTGILTSRTVQVQKGGSSVGTRGILNLIEGSGVTITAVDDSANSRVNVTLAASGSGTVTSVSVTTANGVSGSVATATTTPAISLTLGAITPGSVAASGTVTGSNLSGTNTGDQTSVSGNAGTATALQTARNINGVAFNGTAAITVTAAAGTLSGASLASGVTGSSLTSVGTIGTGVWQGTKVGLTYGGTNADLSATGGASQVLKQVSVGAAVTVAQLAASDLSNGVTGSGAVVLASANTGYCLQASGAVFSPADATTYYWGSNPSATVGTVAARQRIYIPKAGTIKSCYLYFNTSGTLGSLELSTAYIRLNNTTDTSISSIVIVNSVSTSANNTSLSISVSAGDYIEIKWITPTWGTNPTSVLVSAVIYIE